MGTAIKPANRRIDEVEAIAAIITP